ncbi:hypothetical protein NV379_08500 [Paenibacillus sp. N1-5-1-14]|uniref:hypothetical protein n=1 Tax=Paenibacillus radicibacter TaxID=2972488 RepID=UPI002158E07E|nr:hypothetical protein [Paenibacillus radicibacter]MCR8642701.1 hypothetical protein [Paenibacillus radicibacter]
MKKVFTLVLTMLLIISSLSSIVSAKTANPTVEEVDSYMTNAGYPAEVINYLEFDQKKTIFSNSLTYVSHKAVDGNLKEQNDQITPYAFSNFVNYITTSAYGTVNSLKKYHISYNWNWNYNPTFVLTDKFGMAWSDDWSIVNGTAKSTYITEGRFNNATETHYVYSNGQDTFAPGTGIGWKVDLLNKFDKYYAPANQVVSYSTYKHRGYGELDIHKAIDNSGNREVTDVAGAYFHKEGTVNGTLTLSKTPEVGITWGTQYDEAPHAAYSFEWYHN